MGKQYVVNPNLCIVVFGHLAVLCNRPPKPEAYWSGRSFEELIQAVDARHDLSLEPSTLLIELSPHTITTRWCVAALDIASSKCYKLS